MTVQERALRGRIEIQRKESGLWATLGVADATTLTVRRGGSRTGVGIKTDVGLMSFQMIEAQDPLAGGTVAPGQHIRAVSLDHAQQFTSLFTGRVVDVAAVYPLQKATGRIRPRTTVTIADAVAIHGTTPRYGVSIAARLETFESRITRLSASTLAPIEPPVEGAPREVYAL